MANSSAALQRDVVNNVEDLQFFLRDLNQWETQIKKRDEELRTQATKSNKPIPEIRNASKLPSKKSRESKPKPEKVINKTKPERIASSDYKAWDKFDVDAACEKADEATSSSSDDEDEELELNRRRQQAILEKDKGNDYLKAGKINEALECYTKGCSLDPENALLPANRALAFIKTKQYGAAESDCDTALSLDPSYVKAYQRRAAAREALGKYEKAVEDLTSVLKYEPRNKDAANNLEKLGKIIQKSSANLEKLHTEIDPEGELVFPIDKPLHLRSKMPLRRIKVNESKENQIEIKSSKVPKMEPAKAVSVEVDKKLAPSLPKSPSSFFRLQADFSRLKTCPDLKYQYFRAIPCAQYASLFRENLEPNVLSDIIELMGEYYIKNGDDLYEPLRHLALTKRFSTLKFFFSQTEKETLRRIFDHIKGQGKYQEFEIDDLVDIYGLNK